MGDWLVLGKLGGWWGLVDFDLGCWFLNGSGVKNA